MSLEGPLIEDRDDHSYKKKLIELTLLTTQYQDLQIQYNSLCQRHHNVKEKCLASNERNQSLMNELEQAKNEIQVQLRNIDQIKQNEARTKQDIVTQHEKEKQNWKISDNASQDTISQLRKENSQLHSEIEKTKLDLKQQSIQLQSNDIAMQKYEITNKHLIDKVDEQQKQINEKDSEIIKLKQQLESTRTDLQNTQNELIKTKYERDQNNDSLHDLKKDKEELKESNMKLKVENTSLYEKVNKFDMEKQDLMNRITKCETDLQLRSSELQSKLELLHNIEKEKEELKQISKEERIELLNKIDGYKVKIQEISHTLEQCNNELISTQSEIDKLQSKLSESNNNFNVIKTKYSKLKEEYNSLNTDYEKVCSENEELEEAKETSENKITELQKEIESIKNSKSSIQTQTTPPPKEEKKKEKEEEPKTPPRQQPQTQLQSTFGSPYPPPMFSPEPTVIYQGIKVNENESFPSSPVVPQQRYQQQQQQTIPQPPPQHHTNTYREENTQFPSEYTITPTMKHKKHRSKSYSSTSSDSETTVSDISHHHHNHHHSQSHHKNKQPKKKSHSKHRKYPHGERVRVREDEYSYSDSEITQTQEETEEEEEPPQPRRQGKGRNNGKVIREQYKDNVEDDYDNNEEEDEKQYKYNTRIEVRRNQPVDGYMLASRQKAIISLQDLREILCEQIYTQSELMFCNVEADSKEVITKKELKDVLECFLHYAAETLASIIAAHIRSLEAHCEIEKQFSEQSNGNNSKTISRKSIYKEEGNEIRDKLEDIWNKHRIYETEQMRRYRVGGTFPAKAVRDYAFNHGVVGPSLKNQRVRPSDYTRHAVSKEELSDEFNPMFKRGTPDDAYYQLYDILSIFFNNNRDQMNLGRGESDRKNVDLAFYGALYYYIRMVNTVPGMRTNDVVKTDRNYPI